ncbi:hypothetical protein BDF22DRAFT_16484 [Syncephalis plumigaleata]|nr:hypothetical protein BDF22DRAFT_16484 [Syncephalis plumigaleata]
MQRLISFYSHLIIINIIMSSSFKREHIERFLQEQQHCLYADLSHKEYHDSTTCSDHVYLPQVALSSDLSRHESSLWPSWLTRIQQSASVPAQPMLEDVLSQHITSLPQPLTTISVSNSDSTTRSHIDEKSPNKKYLDDYCSRLTLPALPWPLVKQSPGIFNRGKISSRYSLDDSNHESTNQHSSLLTRQTSSCATSNPSTASSLASKHMTNIGTPVMVMSDEFYHSNVSLDSTNISSITDESNNNNNSNDDDDLQSSYKSSISLSTFSSNTENTNDDIAVNQYWPAHRLY